MLVNHSRNAIKNLGRDQESLGNCTGHQKCTCRGVIKSKYTSCHLKPKLSIWITINKDTSAISVIGNLYQGKTLETPCILSIHSLIRAIKDMHCIFIAKNFRLEGKLWSPPRKLNSQNSLDS